MLEHTAFSLADDGVLQTLAFVGFGLADIVFFVWVLYLIRQ
jgi:hypothetical protein